MRTHVLVAMTLLAVAAGGQAQALDVWLDSAFGPPDTILYGDTARFGAYVHAAVSAEGLVYFSLDGLRDSRRFQLAGGDSVLMEWAWPCVLPGGFRARESLGVAGLEPESLVVDWEFFCRLSDVHIMSVRVPRYIDTLTSWVPRVEIRNEGSQMESGWVCISIVLNRNDSVVYSGCRAFESLVQGVDTVLTYQMCRMTTLGQHRGCAWVQAGGGGRDTVYWDMMVYPGVGLSGAGTCAIPRAGCTPTVRGGVLWLEPVVGPTSLSDASGRRVAVVRPGANHVRYLSPGVYFVRMESGEGWVATSKVVITR